MQRRAFGTVGHAVVYPRVRTATADPVRQSSRWTSDLNAPIVEASDDQGGALNVIWLLPMPRFTPTLITLLAASALAASCGGRSALRDGLSASGGGGGSAPTSSTSSTSSSSSGSGGAPPTCDQLLLTGAPITYEPTSFEHGSRPSLVPATDDGSLVSVVLARQIVEGPSVPPIRIVDASFSPWGDWPSTLGPADQVCSFGGEAFAVAPAMAAGQPGFATLFYLPTSSFPSDMYLAPGASPKTSYDPFPEGISWDAGEPAWPVALARGATGMLAAYQIGVGSHSFMSLALVDSASLSVEVVHDVACADAPFTAAAVPAQGGFLVATAAGRAFGACMLDDGVPGPADEVHVMRFDQAKMQLTLSASFEEPDPLAHIALAKRGGGAWVVWQSDGASAEAPPPIRAARLDEGGLPVGPVFPITHDGETTGPFAAASIGPLLAVAWVDSLDPGYPTLRLDLFDEAGALVTGSSINTGPAWLYNASLSLLPSPDGRQLLLAWSDIASPDPATVRVARFSCAAGP